ncbi:33292_t:CDS:1, partial [Gigaspora margarita]
MRRCDSNSPLVIYITKLYNSSNTFSQILSGSVRKSQTIRLLGEGYSINNEENMTTESFRWIFEY